MYFFGRALDTDFLGLGPAAGQASLAAARAGQRPRKSGIQHRGQARRRPRRADAVPARRHGGRGVCVRGVCPMICSAPAALLARPPGRHPGCRRRSVVRPRPRSPPQTPNAVPAPGPRALRSSDAASPSSQVRVLAEGSGSRERDRHLDRSHPTPLQGTVWWRPSNRACRKPAPEAVSSGRALDRGADSCTARPFDRGRGPGYRAPVAECRSGFTRA